MYDDPGFTFTGELYRWDENGTLYSQFLEPAEQVAEEMFAVG